jgi:hypothetical protein
MMTSEMAAAINKVTRFAKIRALLRRSQIDPFARQSLGFFSRDAHSASPPCGHTQRMVRAQDGRTLSISVFSDTTTLKAAGSLSAFCPRPRNGDDQRIRRQRVGAERSFAQSGSKTLQNVARRQFSAQCPFATRGPQNISILFGESKALWSQSYPLD